VLDRQGGKVAGYYSTAGASVAPQAGAQVYGYVLFFLNEKTLDHVKSTEGFEVGVGPSVVLAGEDAGASTTATGQDAIYAFIFDLHHRAVFAVNPSARRNVHGLVRKCMAAGAPTTRAWRPKARPRHALAAAR
jgi:lipid-binding SYLF domain-containing protein